MSNLAEYFSPNWRLKNEWPTAPDMLDALRRWSKDGLVVPQSVDRVFDLGYTEDDGPFVTVSLGDAAILLACPVDYDLLERLVVVRKQVHAETRWSVTLGGNLIGAESEVTQTNLSFEDAKFESEKLSAMWQQANPEAGFGTRRHGLPVPHKVEVFVRVRASTIENYRGTSRVGDKYQLQLAELSELA